MLLSNSCGRGRVFERRISHSIVSYFVLRRRKFLFLLARVASFCSFGEKPMACRSRPRNENHSFWCSACSRAQNPWPRRRIVWGVGTQQVGSWSWRILDETVGSHWASNKWSDICVCPSDCVSVPAGSWWNKHYSSDRKSLNKHVHSRFHLAFWEARRLLRKQYKIATKITRRITTPPAIPPIIAGVEDFEAEEGDKLAPWESNEFWPLPLLPIPASVEVGMVATDSPVPEFVDVVASDAIVVNDANDDDEDWASEDDEGLVEVVVLICCCCSNIVVTLMVCCEGGVDVGVGVVEVVVGEGGGVSTTHMSA